MSVAFTGKGIPEAYYLKTAIVQDSYGSPVFEKTVYPTNTNTMIRLTYSTDVETTVQIYHVQNNIETFIGYLNSGFPIPANSIYAFDIPFSNPGGWGLKYKIQATSGNINKLFVVIVEIPMTP